MVAVGLAVAVLLGRLLAGRTGVPEAAAYAVVGVAIGLLPGLPQPRLSPEVVLLVFLPPLVYYAAFFSDPREMMRHLGAVLGQSVGLVLATAGAAAAILHLIFPDIGWAAALAFGAAIAPPDPVAATSVLQRLGVPSRLVTVLEAEGLINDAVALSLFTIAVANIGTTPGVPGLAVHVLVEIGGGIGFGLLVGILIGWLRRRTEDSLSQVVWSLLTPFLAFIPASMAHSSGVLATVTTAVWLGTRKRGMVPPGARLQAETFWRVLNMLLVSVLFVLLGFQVPSIVAGVSQYSAATLALTAGSVIVVVVLVRIVWVLVVPPMTRRLSVRNSEKASLLSTRERLVLGWCGPRGAVSLAVALSLPLVTSGNVPFDRRGLLLFLTVVVVLTTLVGQVLPLPWLLRRLELAPDERERTERLRARRAMVDAALREVDDIADDREHGNEGLETIRQVLEQRRERLRRALDAETGEDTNEESSPVACHLRLRTLAAERKALRELGDRHEITRRTQVAISQELDLDETRLHLLHPDI